MRKFLTLVFVLYAVPVAAQMHVTVEADKVRLGTHEFVPRFATVLPNVLVVPAGETVTLPADSTYDAIEVAGTLRVDRSRPTTVRFTHLLILPGGTLDAGTEASPVCQPVQFIIRDVPIDLTRDPWQWGNSLVNFGHQDRVGCAKPLGFTQLAQDAPAGATTLDLFEVPYGWTIGDRITLPDTRQMGQVERAGPYLEPRREEPVTITAIAGTKLSITPALSFARPSILDPDGGLVLRPRVANLSRNIVVRSENPNGTRGHTANIGHEASWDIRYNEFIGLGRTQGVDLNNTSVEMTGTVNHTGTNQIGKYAEHDHHAGSSLKVRQHLGNSYDGTGGTKWALAVHGTHDVLVEGNVCVDFQSGCFVTEDGYEVRNLFLRNFAAYAVGNGINGKFNLVAPANCPGCEGAGFWFRGPHQTIEGNEAWGNAIGFQVFYRNQVAAAVPSVRGGQNDTHFDPRYVGPVSFDGNVGASNVLVGFEEWNSPPALMITNTTLANNGAAQVVMGDAEPGDLRAVNFRAYAQNGAAVGIQSSAAYTNILEIDGGEIRGASVGVFEARARLSLKGVTLQNRTNVDYGFFRPAQSVFEDVIHKPLGAHPARFIVLGSGQDWAPGQPLPNPFYVAEWRPNTGTRYVVKNWQGTGQDYLLFENQQRRSKPAYPADAQHWYCPVSGLTMGQCWDTYGLAYGGGVVADEDAVPLEGLVYGVARAGTSYALGPQRAVLVSPLRDTPVTPVDGAIPLRFLLTGNAAFTGAESVEVTIDGGAPFTVRRRDGEAFDTIAYGATTVIAPGWHMLTSRVSTGGATMTFCYQVGVVAEPMPASCATTGEPPPPPPPPHTEVCGDGIDNDGDGQVDEGCVVNPPADTAAPGVSLVVNHNGNSRNFFVSATATDNVGVASAEVRVDGVLLASFVDIYTATIRLARGQHTVTVTAIDEAGNVATESRTVEF
jgi:hypothetical protein